MSTTDKDWQSWGVTDPYYGVISLPEFRRGVLNEEALDNFFSSGEKDIAHALAMVGRINPIFCPTNVLDYGCGVGRLVIPLARRFERATGVDISPAMLAEAAKNTSNLENVSLIHASELDSLPTRSFDFIHSLIVFQHIPARQGEEIFKKLLSLLKPGGIGAIHFTIARDLSFARSMLAWLRRIHLVHQATNILRGRPLSDPPMQMNEYSLSRLFTILAKENCGPVLSEFTLHSDVYGAILFFEKQ
jgi:2-polyprenyl-3-methyl-5-hydroxy-6-metoxy-1,4-benzoquinol methylase